MSQKFAVYGPSDDQLPANSANGFLKRNNANDAWEEVVYGEDVGSVGSSSDNGSANTPARSDHAHAHGDQAGGSLHSAATTGAAGFMSAADKTKVDGVEASADVTDFANVSAALAAASAAVDVNSQKLTGVADPANDQDAATKSYVDAKVEGLDPKNSVVAATTSSIADLSSCGSTIDGVSLSNGDRVLVKDTASPDGIEALHAKYNGLYEYNSGALTRTEDADSSANMTKGAYCYVEGGTSNSGSSWVCSAAGTLGTDAISFTQHSGAAQITAGAGLTKTGNTINAIANGDGSIVCNADDIQVGTLATDGQHGNLGGGALHADATTSVDGFMSAADKQKLDDMGDASAGTVQTTDGTTATAETYTPTDGKAVIVTADVVGRKSDGSQAAAYTIKGCFRRASATTTQVGATGVVFSAEDDATWNATFDTSGADVRVRVTGKAATTVDWSATVTSIQAA